MEEWHRYYLIWETICLAWHAKRKFAKTKKVRWLFIILIPVLFLPASYFIYLEEKGNFHPITPGEAYRSAQLDRTGLAAALWKIFVDKEPKALAQKQLSLRFGHFPIGPTSALDDFLKKVATRANLRSRKLLIGLNESNKQSIGAIRHKEAAGRGILCMTLTLVLCGLGGLSPPDHLQLPCQRLTLVLDPTGHPQLKRLTNE